MTSAATAVTFVWLGMVLAISFLETPLRFRAPGVDLRTGLAIGRLVFRALNTAEIVFAAALLTCVFTAAPDGAVTAVAAGTAILLLCRCSRSALASPDASPAPSPAPTRLAQAAITSTSRSKQEK